MRAALVWFFLALPAAWAQHPCAGCHPRETEGYARSEMARSVGRPSGHASAAFSHALSRTLFTVTSDDTGMRHRLERPGAIAEYPIDFFIGSGRQGRSYLVRAGGRFVQSPISYFTRRSAWDISPGYERDRAPGFGRRISEECLFCHASGGLAEPRPIGCERCHGPLDAHLARPSRSSVVNPRRLPPRARDSVCEQCHLGGEARIPNPGRSLGEFRPGSSLEEVFSVFVAELPAAFRVVSHSEQLAQSACAKASGDRLWCGTCHNPHDFPEDPAAYYRARCAACHAALPVRHPQPAEDCAGCHMPKRPAEDVAHTAYTDHRIQARPGSPAPPAGPARLRAWREPAREIAQRNLGLAYVSIGERDASRFHLDKGFRLLSVIEKPDRAVHTALGLVWMKRNAPTAAVPHFERALEGQTDDPAGLVNLGAALRAAGDVVRAASYLHRALERDPMLAEARELLEGIPDREAAAALYREKKFVEAAAALERHLARQPDDHNARLLLGLSLQQAGSRDRAFEVLRDAARRRPRDPSAHYYLARVEYLRGLLAAAEQHALRALALGEPPARVHNLLGLIRVEQGHHDEALAAYVEAVRVDPQFFDGYLNAGVLLLRLGRADEALERLETALRHNPTFPDARYQRARALIELGRINEARSDLETAAPESEPARRLLDQLRAGGLAPRAHGSARAVAPIRFRNVAEAAGLRFRLENNATDRKHLVETMAGGVAAFDYNNDGRVDIYFTNGAALPSLEKESPRYWNRLFRNDGNMRFTDVTEEAGVAGHGYSIGAASADFDNDGNADLFVAGVKQNILYRNLGGGRFQDVTAQAGIRGGLWSVGAGWFDYDRDGRLDLLVVNYVKWSAAAEPDCLDVSGKFRVYCHPDRYQGLPNTLYRNRGDGTFEDVSAASGVGAHAGKGMSVAFAD